MVVTCTALQQSKKQNGWMRNLFGESTLNYLIELVTDSLWVFVFHSDGSRFY